MNDTSTKTKYIYKGGGAGGIWLMGFVGTLVYFLHFHSGNVTLVLIAIFKALFWPAYLTYYLLQSMSV